MIRSTLVNVGSQITGNGVTTCTSLPPGQYKWVVTTASAIYLALTRIPA
jgi:hypothetical protein